MFKQLVVLTLLSVAMLMAADTPPVPVKGPVSISEVDALKLQVQDQAMQLLDATFQKMQLQMSVFQQETQRLQAEFKVKEATRNEAIKAIYTKAKVSVADFDLDLEHHQLVPKQKAADVPAPSALSAPVPPAK